MHFDYPAGELGRWASIGAVTDRSVRVWYRDPDATLASARLVVDGGEASAPLEPVGDRDGVAAADLVLENPAPSRRFEVHVGGMTRGGRLAPTPGRPAPFAFAFGSCHQPFLGKAGRPVRENPKVDLYPHMLRTLEQRDAGFIALVGDQVYSDGVHELSVKDLAEEDPDAAHVPLVTLYRHLYRGYFNEPGFRSLLERFPTYMTWDDHDIVEGWGSMLHPTEGDRRLFRAADTVYREYQHLRNPGGSLDAQPPYDFAFWYGNVGFFFLDLRGVRDYESGVVIGSDQFGRLDRFMADADDLGVATLFVVASVPVVHISPALVRLLEWVPSPLGTDVRDRLSAAPFDAERDALLDRLFAWQTRGGRRQVAIVSGDVHVAAAFSVRERGGRGQLLQLTSSPLCTPASKAHAFANRVGTAYVNWGEHHVKARLLTLETDNNFGLVSVKPLEEGGHQLTFEIHTVAKDRKSVGVTRTLRSRPRRSQESA